MATFVIAKALWYLSDLASNPRDFRLWLVRDLANCPLYIAVATLRIWAIPFSRHGV